MRGRIQNGLQRLQCFSASAVVDVASLIAPESEDALASASGTVALIIFWCLTRSAKSMADAAIPEIYDISNRRSARWQRCAYQTGRRLAAPAEESGRRPQLHLVCIQRAGSARHLHYSPQVQ
jgi:hypothetical protein